MKLRNVVGGIYFAVLLAIVLVLAPTVGQAAPWLAPATAPVWVAGRQVHFDRLVAAGANLAAPVSDPGFAKMLDAVGASSRWEPGRRFVSVTRADGKLITFTVGSDALSIDGQSQALPFAPFYRGSDLYIPLRPLAEALGLRVRPYRSGFVFVPEILSVDRRIGLQRTIIDVSATIPPTWRTEFDARRRELTVRFPGFGSSPQTLWLGNRDAIKAVVSESGPPGYPTTVITIRLQKDVKYLPQRATDGSGVAIVASRLAAALRVNPNAPASPPAIMTRGPSSSTTAPATATPSPAPAGTSPAATLPGASPAATSAGASPAAPAGTSPAATLPGASPAAPAGTSPAATPESSPSATILPPQKITDVNVIETATGTRIILTLTGPVAFEWHRLIDPDNRYWLDIENATLVGPARTLSSKLPFITGINVSQHQISPQPVARIAITPTQPIDVEVGPIAESNNQMGIEIESATPAPDAPNSGVGTIAIAGSAIGQIAPTPPASPYAATHPDVIIIDAGHGGNDPGAVNPAYGLRESALTLAIADRVRTQLQRLGWQVTMTRDGDYEVGDPKGADKQELQARCDVANSAGGRAFVSIHINSSLTHSLSGTTTYYWRHQDRAFAQAMQNAAVAAAGITNDGIRRESFYVIRHTWMPAVLIETAYLSNAHDASLLQQDSFLDKLATGIVRGIMDYTGGP